eukprot:COSAG06_NODE_8832_length_2059_cov_9.016837_3_plen_67_part_01
MLDRERLRETLRVDVCAAAHYWHLEFLWHLEQSTALVGHSNFVTSAHFSHDGQKIVSASQDKTVRVW